MKSYKIAMLKNRFRRMKKYILQSIAARRNSASPKTIAFVTGVQRSGTNMLMSILDRSLYTDVYMEKDPRAFDRFAMRDLETIDTLIARSPATSFVIKSLLEADSTQQLMNRFKNSKTLWLYRNYDDMVNSYMVSWPGGRNRLDEIVQRGGEGIWQANGMTRETLDIINRHYRPEMNDASALALFWYFRNQLFFDQKLESNDDVMLINYEALVSDPARQVEQVAGFLGMPATPAMTSLVSSRSVSKRPRPEIDLPIRELCDDMTQRLRHVWENQAPLHTWNNP